MIPRTMWCWCSLPVLVLAVVGGVSAAQEPESAKFGTVVLGEDTYKVEWLHRERWGSTWTERWMVEGDAEMKVRLGKLWAQAVDEEKPKVATVWYREDLPDEIIIRFKARVLPPAENNAANVNVFLHAREPNGGSLKFGRSGAYTDYHKIPNYIITLTGGNQPGWSRVRRDPGFNMINEAKVRSEVGKEYAVVIAIQDGHIRYYLNGKKWHDVTDPDPLPGGKFALRTWSTNVCWDDVEFGRIVTE